MDEDDVIQIVSSGSGDDSSSDGDEENPDFVMDTPPARSPQLIVEPLDFNLLASRLGVQPLPSSPGRIPASRAVISGARRTASPYHRPPTNSPSVRATVPAEGSSQHQDIRSTSVTLPEGPHLHPATDNAPIPGPSVLNTSVAEFQTPKRVTVPAPVIKNSTTKESTKDAPEEEEGQDCPICFEPWTNSGSHRLASLKCGHLFGQSCIEKWLKGQGLKCPQCNVKARRKDIRVIYAKALKVTDTSEKDRALQELETERTARKTAEMQAAETRLFLQLARDECRRLTEDLNRQKQHMEQMKISGAASGSDVHSSQVLKSPTKLTQGQRAKFTVEKKIKICENGQCRVMAFSPSHSILCVSQPSANPLFPGFGVKKLNTHDFRTMQYITLHSKMIRDLALNPYGSEGLLLSASMDKTVKLTSLVSNTVVQSYTCPFAAWSCAWNSDDHNYLYAGLQNGTVCLFDTRNTQGAVKILNEGTTMSPAVSLQYIKRNPNVQFSAGGLLVAQLNRTQFLEAKPAEDYKVHMFPLEGSVTSLSIDDRSRHLLATYRPVQTQPSVRHVLYEMSRMSLGSGPAADGDQCTCQRVQSFQGGSTMKVLSRSKLVGHLGSGGLVVAGDEASQCVHVWDIQSGLLHQKIPVHAPVIDIVNIHSNQQPYLAALTDKQVTILKWGE